MNVGSPPGDDQEDGRGKKAPTEPELVTSDSSQSSRRPDQSSRGIWERLRRVAVRLVEQIFFEPQSEAQREQLARKILDYSRMNRRGSEPFNIHVSGMADRFRESRRNVRQALKLLEANETVERTQFKDHWTLTIRVNSPIRATYDPPRVSAPFPTMPLNPPPGWVELQNRAHKAKDAQEFNEIIDEMNRLFSAHEKAVGDGHAPGESPAFKSDRKSASNSGPE
jgi:hypothetical protein